LIQDFEEGFHPRGLRIFAENLFLPRTNIRSPAKETTEIPVAVLYGTEPHISAFAEK
jgi:hypothetical protein